MNWYDKKDSSAWHPFTQMKTETDFIPIVKSEKEFVIDKDGNKWIDGNSSWWTVNYEHRHPAIIAALKDQLDTLEHVIFADATHESAEKLSRGVCKAYGKGMSKTFFSDNGSTAVEVGLKMAIQAQQECDKKKHIIYAIENGYHGDTFGSMSLGKSSQFFTPFEDYLFEVKTIPLPSAENIEQILDQITTENEVLAFVFEPLVQGAGGMRMYDSELLDTIIKAFQVKNATIIADEIMTGFGRTGKNFAMQYCDSEPDIVCLSKGLTGGFMPLGLTLCKEHIYEAFLDDDKSKAFLHGHSFTANPLGCAAANASLELLYSAEVQNNIARLSQRHEEFRKNFSLESRQLGTIMAFELPDEQKGYFSQKAKELRKTYRENKLMMRPLGNTVYLNPPFCISDESLDKIYGLFNSLV